MIPKISIKLINGTLGAVGGAEDGIAGLVIGCDPLSSGIAAGSIFTLLSVEDAITNKINLIPYAYQQVKEFYAEAGSGTKLFVSIVPDTETLTNIADSASVNKYAKKLLDYAGGAITMLGICRKPAAGYTPTTTKGMDDDSIGAIAKMQTLAVSYFNKFTPFVGIIEGRKYMGAAAGLDTLTEGSSNYVGVAIGTSDELNAIDATAASVGLVLGRAANVPVQRKIGRVKDGGLSINGAYLGTTKVEAADVAGVVNKGYIAIGTYPNKTGYYFLDDCLATATTDDYKSVSNRRVINKLVRIVYATYINEVNDDIEIASDGKLSPATAKYYQSLIKSAVDLQMTSGEELSSFDAYVDINQNVLSANKIEIRCSAVPKGYSQEISIVLGFSNPALSA